MSNRSLKTSFGGLQDKVVAIVGLGHVGLPLMQLLTNRGFSTLGIDTNDNVITRLKEEHDVSADYSLVERASVVVVCVPTPVYRNKKPDYRPLVAAMTGLSRHISDGTLIILESTVAPGACERIAIPTLTKHSKYILGKDYFFAYCPERLNPGDPKWHIANTPRVIGGYEAKSLLLARQFYESVIDANVTLLANLREAEATKIVENTFRDINIAFVNELAMSFANLDVDLKNVIEAAATKPFGFLPHYPGVGVGGHCIPVDPYYLIEDADKRGFDHQLLKLARSINSKMPRYVASMLKLEMEALHIDRVKVGVLGVAYKANISDSRESPSFALVEELGRSCQQVEVYDPYVPEHSTVAKLVDLLHSVNCLVVATDHDEFKGISPALLRESGIRAVVDGRNCLDRKAIEGAGLAYRSVAGG